MGRAPGFEAAPGDARARIPGIVGQYMHKLIWLAIWQRPQQDRVHYAEDRRGGADPEYERHERDGADPGGFPHPPQRIRNILPHSVKPKHLVNKTDRRTRVLRNFAISPARLRPASRMRPVDERCRRGT